MQAQSTMGNDGYWLLVKQAATLRAHRIMFQVNVVSKARNYAKRDAANMILTQANVKTGTSFQKVSNKP